MDDSKTRMGASSFTHNGDYFALLSVDGRLRIWDTTSGKVVQEFSPNSVAQSSCTCLCWTKKKFASRTGWKKQKRKRKSGKSEDVLFPSLAIGTDKGSFFCYNSITGEIDQSKNEEEQGHIDKVNCIIYHEESDLVYTCSDDKYVAEWYENRQAVKSKWKAGKHPVKRICLGPGGNTLISAGCSIKLWNIETKELLQSFYGHSTPVSLLQLSPFRQQTFTEGKINGYYFVSGSTEDRVINAWQITSKNPEPMATASFVISDTAMFVDIIFDEGENKSLKLCVGCNDGRIHFFTCTMNGRAARPIESVKTVDILNKEGSSTSPATFLNARLYKDTEVKLMLVTGPMLKPSFTNLCYGELEATSKIVTDVSKNLLLSKVEEVADTSVELANTKNCKKLISGIVSPQLPVKIAKTDTPVDELENVDLQKTGSTEDDLSMEERLRMTQPDTKDFVFKLKPKTAAPNADSFSQMLIGALHSNDDILINEILFNKHFNPKILLNTIKRLPNNLVASLLTILADRLHRYAARSNDLTMWLKTILTVHLTFLMTSEVSRHALSGLYHLVKAQEEMHLPLLKLQGKIELLCSYASTNKSDSSDEDVTTAACVYEDSGDETEGDSGNVGKSDEDVNTTADSDTNTDDEMNDGDEQSDVDDGNVSDSMLK